MFRNILVPLDGSGFAEAALPYALEMAAQFDSDITLLRVVLPPRMGEGALSPDSANFLIKMRDDLYKEAIDYLQSFKGKDHILGPMAKGAIGDAYMELNQNAKAAEYYLAAAELKENEFTSPIFLMKAGWTYELLKDNKKALEVYERIKYDYPTSTEARDIDKYIARVKGS